ncbi:MAG: hypothetical protein JXR70_15360 [Spirochaetales bacterium]|nr:hypothetical protein [Spirochaetales bacterium]
MKRLYFFVFLIISVFSVLYAEENLENIPLDDPVYAILSQCYSEGWIEYLPQIRPYRRNQVVSLLNQAIDSIPIDSDKFLSDTAKIHLQRIKKAQKQLQTSTEEKTVGFFNFPLEATLNAVLNRPGDSVPSLGFSIDAGFYHDNLYFLSLSNRVQLQLLPWTTPPYRYLQEPPRWDYNYYTWFLSQGTEGFNHNAEHLPGEIDMSMVMNNITQTTVDFGLLTFHMGRDVLDWGPSPIANLCLSKTAKAYDYFRFDMPIGPQGTYTWMTGFLQDFTGIGSADIDQKMVTSHRAEMQFTPWFLFAIYESVIYSSRFEMAYLNPLSLYYISEVRLGDYDNKLGGADFIFKLPKSLIYLSIFADDWHTAEHIINPLYYHNIWAGLIGYKIYDLIPRLDLFVEYAHMSHWMYTHREVLGHSNNYSHYGSHLGHFLEPNSHMLQIDASYTLSPQLKIGLSSWIIQHSLGTIDQSFEDLGWDLGAYTNFIDTYHYLDFNVPGIHHETNVDLTLYGEYSLPELGALIKAFYSFEFTHNLNQEADIQRVDHFLTVEARFFRY